MEVIEISHPINSSQFVNENIALAIGFFDGIHIGHQKVLKKMLEVAEHNDLKKAVMTFDPHPSVVLNPEKKRTTYLTPITDKVEAIEKLGVDYCFVVNFSSSFADVSADEFVEQYFIRNHVKAVIAGYDFSFGKYGKGNMASLQENDYPFSVHVVSKQTLEEDIKISTTNIRTSLELGEVEACTLALGRPYVIKGMVVQGEKRGRTIGFPTANVEPSDEYVLPRNGVYAVTLLIKSRNKVYEGVCNVGVKPTFHDPSVSQVSIEVNIFDFEESIYGERVEVFWHHFIRPEQKFNGIDALVEQISKDKEKAKSLLELDKQ
ncbi:bifunctional riboflavin kinase/FAD synthetase [Mammaliicoccus lentus]|jgi:riboflavin kinase/FMN adenylyltransferase|uniref:bifunctional riboflavin kinase/FAD synthetase n=1 Tax=Mammaliicoccus TaxID=2803850 RepID=UPI00085C3A95|nr:MULTISPECIES: bifunctional riboflavin kinase/FAD synthetase [Mammaliicoccus]HBV04690.1 bifunctional riboflavin kinase/FAD synthetase [Staphylococcus sp.]MBF0793955.1 bifunctional riboflavin kinase/FAD synthetase [Mammaliicoccus lentus]MBW0761184.1 bifunctional riboflavin kinase/FAD synthetase [Mammaliicoccus lentus]MCR1872148.1 bifunctional riboflavin kinase/FAD synthetase [Mammaliicoccus lentus]MDQ7142527.1 bifunctional riboflavin kinase/FAD synthetase [Mammaliicoccus lentus]